MIKVISRGLTGVVNALAPKAPSPGNLRSGDGYNYNIATKQEGDIGIFGFGYFVPKEFGFSVLVFIAVCGFFVF